MEKQKSLKIMGISLLLAIIVGIVYYSEIKKSNPSDNEKTKPESNLENIQDDSITGNTTNNITASKEKNEEEPDDKEEDFEVFYVIANDVILRNKPTATENTEVKKLKFGDKIYAKSNDTQSEYKKVYLTMPVNNKKPTEQIFYTLESVIADEYSFQKYKDNFSLHPFLGLASKTKKLILNNNYSNGKNYNLTQNADRAKNVLAYGDYDNDGITDIAIVLDNIEKQCTRLLVIGTNKETKNPYLVFEENYSDIIKINSFKKGAKIFMYKNQTKAASIENNLVDENGFSKSPNSGLIIKGEDIKIAIIYDKELQKFKTYYQE